MKLRPLTCEEVTFSLEAMEDDSRPDFQSGDPAYKEEDDRLELDAMERLSQGDVWAWACVKVTAQWGDYTAKVYLGGCSYTNEAEFRSCGELWALEEEALDKLNDSLGRIYSRLSSLVEA